MLFRSKAEAARCGEVERARITGDLSDHAGQIAAPHPFFESKERIFGRFRLDMDQPVSQVGRQSGAKGAARTLDRPPVLHPQHLTAILHLCQRVFALPACHLQRVTRQRQREPRPARIIGMGEYLAMQRLIGKTRTPARLTRL